MYIIFSRYRALQTPSNILLVNLCVAGLIMISPLPLFYINLYQRGPHLGIIGAKVRLILILTHCVQLSWCLVVDSSDLVNLRYLVFCQLLEQWLRSGC